MSPGAARIVVVGSCASGKSTLVRSLRGRGFDAYVCAQEHSEIPTLWNHLRPDFVVFLEADLATIRQRRSPNWSETIFIDQKRRLLGARDAADLIIDTVRTGASETVNLVVGGIPEFGERGS